MAARASCARSGLVTTLKLTLAISSLLTPLFPDMRPEVSTEERGKSVYAETQPFGHSAPIDPKSSWRRWRALRETQSNGQLLMDAVLRKSQASWVVSNGAVPSPS